MDKISIEEIALKRVIPLINKKWLINGLWQLKGDITEGERIFNDLVSRIDEFGYAPKFVFRVMGTDEVRFALNRELLKKFSRGRRLLDRCSLLGATVGDKIVKKAEEVRAAGGYHEYFCLYGLSAALAEAATEYGHIEVGKGLGLPREGSFRISPGYPVWPDISDQKKIDGILRLGNIGVSVSDTNLLIPEFSTTALILFTE